MDSLDYLGLLDDPATCEPVLTLLIAVAGSDGIAQEDEIVLLLQLQPRRTRDELVARVAEVAANPPDLDALARALPGADDRWRALRFAARMAWTDRFLASKEKLFLVQVGAAFGLPLDAVETVLDEMIGQARAGVDAVDVWAAINGMAWEELEFRTGHPRSALAEVAPDEPAIGVLSAEGVEGVALFPSGIAAGFREGDAFVSWAGIASYSRIPVFGAAVRLETRDGRMLTLVDVRLRAIAAFLDRIYAR